MHLSYLPLKREVIHSSYITSKFFPKLNVKTEIPLLKKKKKKVWRIGRLHIYVNLQKTWKHAAPTHQENYYLCSNYFVTPFIFYALHFNASIPVLHSLESINPNVSRASYYRITALIRTVQDFCSLPVA